MKVALSLITLSLTVSCQTQGKVPAKEKTEQDQHALEKPESEDLDPQTLVGALLEDAQKTCEALNQPHRVIKIDGRSQMITRDFRPDRLNFTVEKGIVTGVTKG